jgi:hypothetical protein
MSWRPRSTRLARVLAAVAVAALALPPAALATPSPDSCAANRAITYTAPVPAGLRVAGTRLVQWRAAFTDAYSGEPIVDDGITNQVTIDADAPAYPNTVLIRLIRSTTILANGTVVTVPAMRPDQDARMHANISWVTGDKWFAGDFVLSFRFQAGNGNGKWSGWYPTAAGPEQSFCGELTDAVWKRSIGWAR